MSSSFSVIIFGSIQIEKNQIRNPLTKGVNYLAALKVACYLIRQLKYKLKMIIQTERFREYRCKHCKTAMLVEKNLATFWLATLGVCGKILLFSLLNFSVICLQQEIDYDSPIPAVGLLRKISS